MADILIRMEMPIVCGRCPIEQFNEGFSWEMYCCPLIKDGYTTDIREDERRDDCPLVELPEHGDLIDRDAVSFSDSLFAEPVIIPANKEETDAEIH